MAPPIEPQLEPIPTFSAQQQIFDVFDGATAFTDSLMLQTREQDHPSQDSPSVRLRSPVDIRLAYGLQSGSRQDSRFSDLTVTDYQSPLQGTTASSSATGEELKTPSESSTAAVQCDFEGCGRICRDYESLRYVILLNL